MIMPEQWREVGANVFVRRHQSFDVNVGLVVGDGGCLVIDTRATHGQARELIEAIRTITSDPWTVVNTHGHFDHCFGNNVFRPAEIWAHERCAAELRLHGEQQRRALRQRVEQDGRAHLAAELAEVVIDPADRVLSEFADLVIGGRPVELRFLGRGHTDQDIVVVIPDSDVIFTGDLVEEGAPPDFDDSFPLNWPATVAGMLPLGHAVFVPGHGAVVDRDYVEQQAGDLEQSAMFARAAHAAGRPADEVWAELPFPEAAARTAVARAYLQLDDPATTAAEG